MTVLAARDGVSVLTLATLIDPDVILLDALMPQMDGFETCRSLKDAPQNIVSPIIFMTGLDYRDHILKGLRSGAVA